MIFQHAFLEPFSKGLPLLNLKKGRKSLDEDLLIKKFSVQYKRICRRTVYAGFLITKV
jgi:hypothetical protein